MKMTTRLILLIAVSLSIAGCTKKEKPQQKILDMVKDNPASLEQARKTREKYKAAAAKTGQLGRHVETCAVCSLFTFFTDNLLYLFYTINQDTFLPL